MLVPQEDAEEWLLLPIDKRALSTYKQTMTQYSFSEFPTEICSERNIHEIEKTIHHLIDLDWVFVDEFMKAMMAPLSENSKMFLKKDGTPIGNILFLITLKMNSL